MLFAALCIFLISLLIYYNIKKHNYWSSEGIFTPPSVPFLGHVSKCATFPWKYQEQIYKIAKRYEFSGFYEFFSPKLFIYNPEHIRLILVKDFDHFVDRRTFVAESKKDKLFNDVLINTSGAKWKSIRAILTPSFSSGKLKAMFQIVSEIADELVSYCKKSSSSGSTVEMHDAFGRYALDVIACCAFGVEGKTIEQGDSEFNRMMNSVTKFSFSGLLKLVFLMTSPKLFAFLGLSLFTEDSIKLVKIVKKTIDQRRKESSIRRGDFVDLILEAHENFDKKEIKNFDFDEDSMIAQSFLFLLAGYETVRNTSTFILNDLAKHPEVQAKAREELLELTRDGDLTYQKVMEAKYLDALINESMRLSPTAYFLERNCTKRYEIPGTNVSIPKNQIVDIPVWSLHRDPEYWEDPLEFRPSRFLPENKDKIVPYTYMPFGLGPRNCIGSRFALLEMKVAMAKLILAFEVTHPPLFELKLKQTSEVLRPDSDGLLMNFKPLFK